MTLHDVVVMENRPATTAPPRSSRRRNRKKVPPSTSLSLQKKEPSYARWKSESQQQIYSSKLLEALSKVNLNPSSPSAPRQGRAVREAADRALALTARGRTLWSRSILINRVKLKFRKTQNNKFRAQRSLSSLKGSTTDFRSRKQRFSVLSLKGKNNIPAVQRKARVLGRLVPGCGKQSLPVILEETTDYIAALEMQVRTMSAVAELLSGGSSSSVAGVSPPTSSS